MRRTSGMRVIGMAVSLAFAAFATGVASPVVADEPVMHLAVAEMTDDAPVIRVLARAYKNLGIKLVLDHFPRRRGPLLANEGHSDGLPMALGDGALGFENLMPVPVPLCKIAFLLYSVRPLDLPSQRAIDLKAFKVGTIRGVRTLERQLQGLDIIPASSFEQLFDLLKRGRIQLALSPSSLQILEQTVPGGFHSYPAPLKPAYCYHLLHKSKANLLPRIAESLRAMIRSGELAALYKTVDAEDAAITGEDLQALGPSGGLDQISADWRAKVDPPSD